MPRVFVQGCFRKPHPQDGTTDSMSSNDGACASCQNADSVADCEQSCQVNDDISSRESQQSDDDGNVTNRTDDDRNIGSDIAACSQDDGARLNLTDDDKLHEIT